MTLPLSPTTSNDGNAQLPSPTNSNANQQQPTSNPTPPVDDKSASTTPAAGAASTAQMKRKPSRRANTAERRATHNAVERQRRETLNGRFLDLAALLPNLSQIRRPSKSSIVNSSIAHIHASRRHRVIAARELRLMKAESDALRRELNEWRDRAGIPRVEEPARTEGFSMVLSGELEVIPTLPGDLEEDEDGEDGLGPVPVTAVPNGGPYSGPAYDDFDEDMIPLAGSYHNHQQPQQQMHQQHPHNMPMAPQHHQAMMGLDDMDDHRIAAMLLKSAASNPFAHNLPSAPTNPNPNSSNGRSGPGSGFDGPGYAPSFAPFGTWEHHHQQQQQMMQQAQRSLFTPPASSHGLPPGSTGRPPSNHGSPNSNNTPASPVGSTASSQGQYPAGVSPPPIPAALNYDYRGPRSSHGANPRMMDRERSGSISTSASSAGSPGAYDLHSHHHSNPIMHHQTSSLPRFATAGAPNNGGNPNGNVPAFGVGSMNPMPVNVGGMGGGMMMMMI